MGVIVYQTFKCTFSAENAKFFISHSQVYVLAEIGSFTLKCMFLAQNGSFKCTLV